MSTPSQVCTWIKIPYMDQKNETKGEEVEDAEDPAQDSMTKKIEVFMLLAPNGIPNNCYEVDLALLARCDIITF